MAEETKENKQGAQTNELGELFVKFGSEGLGGLVKGLNAVAGTFLLGKNAAEQFTKPLIDMSKKAAGTVTNFDKISTVTGLTVQELQRLEIFSKQNSVDFNDTITNIAKLQQSVLGLKNGLQTKDVFGLNLLGFNPQDLDYKKPIQAYEKIMARIVELQKRNPAVSAQAAGLLGISDEQIYLFSQGNRLIDERLILTHKEAQNLRELQTAWNDMGITASNTINRIIGEMPLISKGINDLKNFIGWFNDRIGKSKEENYQAFSDIVEDAKKNLKANYANRIKEQTYKLMFEYIPLVNIIEYGFYKNEGSFKRVDEAKNKLREKWGLNDYTKNHTFIFTPAKVTPVSTDTQAPLTQTQFTTADVVTPPNAEQTLNNYNNANNATSVIINQTIASTDPSLAASESSERIIDSLSLTTAQRTFSSGL